MNIWQTATMAISTIPPPRRQAERELGARPGTCVGIIAEGTLTPMRALYISYDGMTDPLGGSQVPPYLQGLSQRGHEITLLSCEKPARMAAEGPAVRAICDAAGIDWQPVAYHKSPPILSGMIDVAALK